MSFSFAFIQSHFDNMRFVENSQAVVMVVGAGRGPLVRSAFNASANVDRKIKMYVVEKNPNAIVTLSALQEEMWNDKGKLGR